MFCNTAPHNLYSYQRLSQEEGKELLQNEWEKSQC